MGAMPTNCWSIKKQFHCDAAVLSAMIPPSEHPIHVEQWMATTPNRQMVLRRPDTVGDRKTAFGVVNIFGSTRFGCKPL
jgi:hypothetical protein